MAGPGIASANQGKAFSLAPYSYAEARALAEELDLAEPVAVTLVRRGHRTVAEARAFLDAAESHDPFEFEAMTEVVERLRSAVAAGTRITVHGDYDVDGVSATAILVRSLRELGADCDWYIPDRLGDGYGLTVDGVETLAARGTGLLVTADCGISCPGEVDHARSLGIEVIVTDHHQPGEALPECPILHPVVSGYPCEELCATGVAYKLAAALRGEDRVAADLDLVALATVADLVPLRGENRALVRRGLAEMRRARRPGLRALLEVAATRPERLDEGDVAFRLAPRINAAGRLYRADAGVELMLTEDGDRAAAIAAELDRANRERRAVEAEVLEGAERALRELSPDDAEAPGLVLAGEGWHPGVVGIVASRLAERLWRPVVLVGLDGAGRARGSGRSIPGFDLLAALTACDPHLTRYGGHRAAAGVELERSELERFRAAFARHAGEVLAPSDLVRTEPVDAVVGGESLGHDVAEQLTRLAPFGLGNPGVRLLVPGARIGDVRPMGEGDRHARFSIRSGPRAALGVAFGVNGELEAAVADPHDVSVRLELNEWNGAVEPRVVLKELYPSERGDDPPATPRDVQAEAAHPDEFWERFDAELRADLGDWPPSPAPDPAGAPDVSRQDGAEPQPPARLVIDRRGTSGVAAVAALASSGESVLVACADAVRRRALVEEAVRPARFGGGDVALISGRCSLLRAREAVATLLETGSGVALADWAGLRLWPDLARRFTHIVIVDPPAYAHAEAAVRCGEGYLHVVAGPGETDLSLRALAEDWPGRDALAIAYRALGRAAAGGAIEGGDAYTLLSGAGAAQLRAPEAAARRVRVLAELELVACHGSGIGRTLGVVSSRRTDLSRSGAFAEYARRREEGTRYLSGAT